MPSGRSIMPNQKRRDTQQKEPHAKQEEHHAEWKKHYAKREKQHAMFWFGSYYGGNLLLFVLLDERRPLSACSLS